MGATLDALQVLQQIELKRNALLRKMDSKQRLVRAHQKKIEIFQRDAIQKHEAIQQQQSAISKLELDIKTHDAELSKLREALNRSKTNKEYAAVLSQINTDKADNSKLEDRVLELMDTLEEFRNEEQEIKEHILKEQQGLDNAAAVAETFRQSSEDELNEIERKRAEAASAVPATALGIFERVAERHDGEALATAFQPHPKRQEYICSGCNMNLTLEQFLTLQSRDDIQVCNSCGRVLYIENQLV